MKKGCLYALLFIQCTVPEPSNVVDKYAVSVQRNVEVAEHFYEKQIGPFCKDNFLFFRVPIRRTNALWW